MNKMENKHEHFDNAVKYLKTKETVSLTNLRDQFNLVYNSASKLIDQLENKGIIGSFEGIKQRKVLKTKIEIC